MISDKRTIHTAAPIRFAHSYEQACALAHNTRNHQRGKTNPINLINHQHQLKHFAHKYAEFFFLFSFFCFSLKCVFFFSF